MATHILGPGTWGRHDVALESPLPTLVLETLLVTYSSVHGDLTGPSHRKQGIVFLSPSIRASVEAVIICKSTISIICTLRSHPFV